MLLVYGWFAFTHLPTSSPSVTTTNVLGANSNITLFEQPDTGRKQILDAITTES